MINKRTRTTICWSSIQSVLLLLLINIILLNNGICYRSNNNNNIRDSVLTDTATNINCILRWNEINNTEEVYEEKKKNIPIAR